jgi:hypothetical protein
MTDVRVEKYENRIRRKMLASRPCRFAMKKYRPRLENPRIKIVSWKKADVTLPYV